MPAYLECGVIGSADAVAGKNMMVHSTIESINLRNSLSFLVVNIKTVTRGLVLQPRLYSAEVLTLAFLSTALNTLLISALDNFPSSKNARESPSTTVATPAMPAMKQAFHIGTPAIAPAPMTPRPDAANVATILKIILFKVFNLPSYSNDLS